MNDPLTPEQQKGTHMDVAAAVTFNSPEQAGAFFQVARERLANVSSWASVCGTDTTTFELLDAAGAAPGALSEGNLLRIDIPGPGTAAGEGYDWVRIEEVKEETKVDEQFFGFRVRPCPNPGKPEEGVAHFFTHAASSTFLVKRTGNEIMAAVHGRNEKANSGTPGFWDSLRNIAVGNGARIGLSYPQWKLLVEGLVKTDDRDI